jgi:riboflavin synthase
MFTGIVQGLATVKERVHKDNALSLCVGFELGVLEDLAVGASIAINGVCLTVTQFGTDWARFDVIDETLARTSLGALQRQDRVNFERAARFGSEIGGHLLSGHVCDTVRIVSQTETVDNRALEIEAGPSWAPYIFPKGFVAVDGVSLTVGEVDDRNGRFWVHLIPETLSRTTLGFRSVGEVLNLEIDAMTQAVVQTVRRVLAVKKG